jgi:dihydropteroate synthase
LGDLGRCRVIGVVNVTPDSFSDGGRHFHAAAAIEHGLELYAAGADLVDVGGESTRPGAARVPVEEEIRRILPVVRDLAGAGVPVSIDTMRRETAQAALDAGAAMVNDVSGGVADPALPGLVAAAGVPYVVMHWRGHSLDMQAHAEYVDVVAEVKAELAERLDAVVASGVRPEQVVLDPGIGFAKTAAHNWELLSALDELTGLGRPLLVGVSRKSFLGSLLGTGELARHIDERADATAAVTTLAAAAGAWAVRVHDVRANADAVRVVAAVAAARAARVDDTMLRTPHAPGETRTRN